MAQSIVNLRLQDSESDVTFAPFPVWLPSGLTVVQYQAFVTALAPLLDAVTGAKIIAADVLIGLTLPGGLKGTPEAGILNERGGLVGMSTDGTHNDSFRVPAITTSIMPGNAFSIADTDVAALIAEMVTGEAPAVPQTRDGFAWVAGLYGKKSFRR